MTEPTAVPNAGVEAACDWDLLRRWAHCEYERAPDGSYEEAYYRGIVIAAEAGDESGGSPARIYQALATALGNAPSLFQDLGLTEAEDDSDDE